MENGLNGEHEKILVYLGPSLSLARARAILPQAVYKPPCKQGDITSDVVNESPNRIILIDGEFRGNLSPWHKEIVYALQYPGVTNIYGAASMGALRAAELDWLGMIGVGQIYEWYRDGVTEDDSEVALQYAQTPGGDYQPLTVPLVDIRAGVEHCEREFPGEEIARKAREFLEVMRSVYYMERTPGICDQAWDSACGVSYPCIQQKAIDAITVLTSFKAAKAIDQRRPTPENLSMFFQALYERDRRIRINGTEIPEQHIDAHVMLHNPEYERICWDASNQELALLLCNCLCVFTDIGEVVRESARFQARAGIETPEDFENFLANNGWTRHEFDRLMIQLARIRKLQHSLTVSKAYRRNTQSILDYLRTHQGFDYWAIQVAQAEEKIKQSGVDDWLGINLETPVSFLLAEHMDAEGLELKSSMEEYLLETGFSNLTELGVALGRTKAGKE